MSSQATYYNLIFTPLHLGCTWCIPLKKWTQTIDSSLLSRTPKCLILNRIQRSSLLRICLNVALWRCRCRRCRLQWLQIASLCCDDGRSALPKIPREQQGTVRCPKHPSFWDGIISCFFLVGSISSKKLRFSAISGFQPSNRPTEATWKTTMKFGYHRTIAWL